MNVVSLSLFRHRQSANAAYYRGLFYPHHLPAILRAYMNLLPGWQIRVYHDDSVNRGRHAATLHALQAICPDLVKLERRPQTSLCSSMLWRLRPFFDETVDAFICRDLESLPTPREVYMIHEWLESGKAVHAIHDAPAHGGPLMGGMIGFRRAEAMRLAGDELIGTDDGQGQPFEILPKSSHTAGGIDMQVYGSDQTWMNDRLWPKLRGSSLLHKRSELPSKENEEGVDRRDGGCSSRLPDSLVAQWTIGELDERLIAQANALTLHVGLVFDSVRATEWWEKNGTPAVNNLFARVAQLLGSREEFACEIDRMPEDRSKVDQWMADSWQRVQLKYTDAPRVILSSDDSTNYCFLLPLAVAFWRMCGRLASVVLIYRQTPAEWWTEHRLVVYQALRALGAEVHFAKAPDGYGSSTAAQVSRLLGGALPVNNCPVITCDADMLPLRADAFALPCGHQFNLYCANAYNQDRGLHQPMCYVEARAQSWREMLSGAGASDPSMYEDDLDRHLSGSLSNLLAGLDPSDHGNAWSYDERLLSKRLSSLPADLLLRVNRPDGEPPPDRLDRAHYPEGWMGAIRWNTLGTFVDCHVMREPHEKEQWKTLSRVVGAYLPDLLWFFDEFQDDFSAAVKLHRK